MAAMRNGGQYFYFLGLILLLSKFFVPVWLFGISALFLVIGIIAAPTPIQGIITLGIALAATVYDSCLYKLL